MAYSLFIWVQYPVSAAIVTTSAFYTVLLPALLIFIALNSTMLQTLLALPAIRLFGALFLFIPLHALLIAPDKTGLGKTIGENFATAGFFTASFLFMAYAPQHYIERFFRISVALASVCAIFSLYRYFAYYKAIDPRLIPIGRASHQILGALTYGSAGIIALYLCRNLPARQRIFPIGAILLIGYMMLLTQSRTALAGYGFCLMLGWLLYSLSFTRWIRAVVIFALAIAIALAIFPQLTSLITGYLHAITERKDSFRLELWQLTWEKIQHHPWRGNGMRAEIQHPAAYMPHNLYLATLFYLGIPGFILFMGGLLLAGIHALKLLVKKEPLGIVSILLLLNGLISGLTDHGQLVKSPSPLWIILWMPLAFILALPLRKRNAQVDASMS